MGADLAGKHACTQSDNKMENPFPRHSWKASPEFAWQAGSELRCCWARCHEWAKEEERGQYSTPSSCHPSSPPRCARRHALTVLTASCCPPCLLRPLNPGPAHLKAHPGWGQVPIRERAAGGRAAHLSCIGGPPLLFLFLPPSHLSGASSHPALLLRPSCTCRLPALQPTDERSWVYSPLHYSAQAHSASDGESDTVSVPMAYVGLRAPQGQRGKQV